MTIESEYREGPKAGKKEIEFPVLARSKKNGEIICFTSLTKGTVVFSILAPIWHESESWVHVNDKKTWTILSPDESVVLRNVE